MPAIPLSHQLTHDEWVLTPSQIGGEHDGTIPAESGAQIRAAMESPRSRLQDGRRVASNSGGLPGAPSP